ncbi:hypothetical protein WAK64_17600 [Bacillus spongiae]|uniref:Uncharacterized protein n=1 Tax=Bacillus spongiae TaxID=2683610 RepID=A0ABU8HHW9_9BACI
MEIPVSVRLDYWNGKAVTSGWERLDVVVKFKEKGNLFRTKLCKTIATKFNYVHAGLLQNENNRYETEDEYYEEVEYYLNSQESVIKVAEEMINKYFEDHQEKDGHGYEIKEITRKINKFPKLKVNVKVQ